MARTPRSSTRDASAVTSVQLRASLDELTEDALRPVAGCLVGLYAFYTLVYAGQSGQVGSGTGLVMSAITSVFFLAVRLGLRGRELPRSMVNPLGASYGLVVGVNCLVSEAVTHNAELSPNLMLAIVSVPLFLLSLRWLVGLVGGLVAGWFVVQNTALSGTSWHVQSYPMIASVVVATLVYGVRRRTHRRLEETRLALRRAAVVDELTGVYNRRGFLEAGQELLDACEVEGAGAVLLFVDVDGLKRVNDSLGHGEGDAVLRAAADVLRNTFRGDDVVGRLGGDEFAVLLREPSHAAPPVERLLSAVAKASRLPGGTALSLSVGVAASRPLVRQPLNALLSLGDHAMYEGRSARSARIG